MDISTLNLIPKKQIRQVRSDDKNLLEELLLQYRPSLLNYEGGESIKSVVIPNIYVKFDLFQVKNLLKMLVVFSQFQMFIIMEVFGENLKLSR